MSRFINTNVLAVVKGAERYVFVYDDDQCCELLRTIGRYAADPELSFSWYDAAVLSQRIRQHTESVSRRLRNRLSLRRRFN